MDEEDELDRALKNAWLGEAPQSERRLAGRLSKEMRDVVAHRLDVLLRRERETLTARPIAADAAAAVGLSRQRFYAMAKDYYATRSIAALGARAAEKRTRPPRMDPEIRAAAASVIAAAMREDPGSSVASVARRLTDAEVSPISYSMVRRLWLEARRDLTPGAFGAELLFDSVGLDAVRGSERMRLYLVIDMGSGLVLGSCGTLSRWKHWGIVQAAVDALENLEGIDLSGLSAAVGEPRIVLNVQPDDGTVSGAIERRLAEAGLGCEIDEAPAGRAAVGAIGERLGSIWLGIGERDDGISYRNGRKARLAEYTLEVDDELRQALKDHNVRRLASSQGDTSHPGSMDEARRTVSRVLAVLADRSSELEALPMMSS